MSHRVILSSLIGGALLCGSAQAYTLHLDSLTAGKYTDVKINVSGTDMHVYAGPFHAKL